MDMSKRLRRKFILVAMASVVVVLAGIIAAINVVNYCDVCNQADARLLLIQQDSGASENEQQQDPDNAGSEASGGSAEADGEEGRSPVETAGGQSPVGDSSDAGVDSDGADRQGAGSGGFAGAGGTGNSSPEGDGSNDPDPKSAPGSSGVGQPAITPRGNVAEVPFESRYFTVQLASDGSVASVNTEKVAAISTDEAAQMAQGVKAGSMGFVGAYRYQAVQQEDGTVWCIFLDCSRDLGNFASFLTASIVISLAGLVLVFALVFALSRIAIRPVVESYQKQKEFITDASHEIKTPLAVISAANEVQEMEQGETEWSRSIAEQVRRLSALTEQLVQLARMDEGAASFSKGDVDFSSVVAEAADPFKQVAEQRGKSLSLETDPEVRVQGDSPALAQVVELLLDNATRYAKEGSQIELSLHKRGRKAQLVVSNEVDRMPEGDLDRLFERFYRDDSSRSSQTGGSGVGLSVVRSVAEAHGGSAKASSQGDRILFTITILGK